MSDLIEGRDIGWFGYWSVVQTWRRFSPEFRLRHAWELSHLCARIWLALSAGERNRTRQNLKLMLGEGRPEDELDQISLEHHAAHAWAFIVPDILPFLSEEQTRALGEVRGIEHLEKALSAGRGACLLSAHYGSHGYLLLAILRAYGVPVTAVAGREGIPAGQDEPEGSLLYKRVFHPLREFPRSHLPMLTRGLVPDPKILAVIKNNEVLWFQGDMHLTEEEIARERNLVRVPFLWGEASFRAGPVRLPKLFKAPVLPCFAVRQGPRLVVEIEAPLQLTPGGSYEDTAADLRSYLDRLEPRILAMPDQWAFTRHENLAHWIKPVRESGTVGLNRAEQPARQPVASA